MDWKAILALAVLVAPLAYCAAEMESARLDAEARNVEACASAGGSWNGAWGGTCGAAEP